MLDKEEVQEVIAQFSEGEASLEDLWDAFDDWDGDPFEVL